MEKHGANAGLLAGFALGMLHVAMASSLRGEDGSDVDEAFERRDLGEVNVQPAMFYVLMPFISGLVGWGTNVIALKMTFYPLKFWGWEVFRLEGQPAGLFGWQGIVPAKARKMASDSVDLMTEKLFDVKEIFQRIEIDKASEHLKVGFEATMERLIDDIADKYIMEKSTPWKRTEAAVKQQITDWAMTELPGFTGGFMGELVENLDDVYDLKDMCVTEMVDNPQLLVDVFTSVGAKELRFIERSGFYFGFIFGCVQTLFFRFAGLPSPSIDYSLPALGAAVGYLTNWLALKLIFQPIEPIKIMGGRFTLQGLFLKRQREASAKFASKMVASVLHSENIWHHMMTGPKSDGFETLLRKHADDFTGRMVGFTQPLVESYMGAENFVKMRAEIQDITVQEIVNIVEYMHDYTNQALDLETEIRTKMTALPSKEFERVLHPVFEEDEFKLILVGAFLGAAIGAIQMAVALTL